MQEYSIQRSQRRCQQTDRAFVPGESYYSAVTARGGELRRIDVAYDVWQGPPDGAIGWWVNRMPEKKAPGAAKPAPPHVLIAALESLLEDGMQGPLAYLLALLLVRRRILTDRTEAFHANNGTEEDPLALLHLTHGPSNRDFVVPICEPSLDESQSYQDELTRLLFCEA